MTDLFPCVLPVVERAKREILRDMATGHVPATVKTFAELHDHVDANYYGGAFEVDPDTGKGWWDSDDETQREDCVRFWNAVQTMCDKWLQAGRPLLGDRVRMKVAVDREPSFTVPAGSIGFIQSIDADLIMVRLESHRPDLDEWENCVHFYNATSYGRYAPPDGYGDFATVVEFLDRPQPPPEAPQ